MSQQNVEIVRSLFSSFEQLGPEGTIRFVTEYTRKEAALEAVGLPGDAHSSS